MPARSPRPLARGRLHSTKAFPVPGFSGRYPLTIYLPPGYDAHPEKRWPVAYMFDGQNLFGDEGSFSGGWHMHETLDKLASRKKKSISPIVVGIHHGGASRINELTPWKLGRRQGGGHGEAFLDWVAGPLQAMVNEDLRTLTGPANTLIGGSSLGGLMALYALFRRPEVFGRALCMSPSLWVANGAIFRFVESTSLPWTRQIYLDAGGREGGMLRHGEAMARLLLAKGVPSEELLWRPEKQGSHNERAWRRRLPKALRFFYG